MAIDIEKVFTYHAPKEGQPAIYETIRKHGKNMAQYILEECPDSRERSVALTKIQEAVMWANASIAING